VSRRQSFGQLQRDAAAAAASAAHGAAGLAEDCARRLARLWRAAWARAGPRLRAFWPAGHAAVEEAVGGGSSGGGPGWLGPNAEWLAGMWLVVLGLVTLLALAVRVLSRGAFRVL
jgi:hypothetical protein